VQTIAAKPSSQIDSSGEPTLVESTKIAAAIPNFAPELLGAFLERFWKSQVF
jgi:hypothetical protein